MKKGSVTYNRIQALKKRLWDLYKTKEEIIQENHITSVFYRGVKFQRVITGKGMVEYFVWDTSTDNYTDVDNTYILESLLNTGEKLEDYNDKQKRAKPGKAIYPIGIDRVLETVGS